MSSTKPRIRPIPREKRLKRLWTYDRLRFLTLTGSFLFLLSIPLLGYYLHFTFFQGYYQSLAIGHLWFVSPLEGLEALLLTRSLYGPLVVGILWPVLLALLLGRVFCSWVCPISFFFEIIEWIHRKVSMRTYIRWNRDRLPRQTLWVVLGGELFLALVLGKQLFAIFSPPALVGREMMMAVYFHTLSLEGIVLLMVLSTYFLSRRFYCRHLCPLGALLALLGAKRKLVIVNNREICGGCDICDMICPIGLRPSIGEAETVYCWNCGSCVDACRFGSLQFTWRTAGKHLHREEETIQPLVVREVRLCEEPEEHTS